MNIIENGKEIRVKLCTKCLKRIKKDVAEGVRPFLQLAQYQKQMKEVKTQKAMDSTPLTIVLSKAERTKVKSTNKKSKVI